MPITLRVNGTGVPTTTVAVPDTATGWSLATAVEAASQNAMPANRMRLIYQSKVVPFKAELASFKMTNGSTVLVARANAELYAWKDEDHAPKWDYDFRDIDDSGESFQRGPFDYIRPCGFFRFGFTVYGRYDGGNNAWLRTDSSAWPVAYFATGYNNKGESLRSAGYTASKACATPPIDPPFGYFFTMDVALVEPYATTFTAEDGATACTVVVQARVDPSKITLLSNGIWAARSADAFRPYGLLVKGVVGSMSDAGQRKRVLLAALNSLLPYAEVLPKAEYYGRTAGGVERGAGEFCPDTCVQVLSIGGNLYSGTDMVPIEHETYTLEWPDWVDRDLADGVLSNPCLDTEAECKQVGNDYVISGPRNAVHSLTTLLLAAMDRLAPVDWTSKGMEASLVALNTNGETFRTVSDKFFETMPDDNSVRIVRIERVENRRQFARYRKYRDATREKCRSSKRPSWNDDDWEVERDLWHGTSGTPPASIYKGDIGFCRNFSADGFWGRATYFAQNASYSDNGYAYTLQENGVERRQLFLVTVVTGMWERRARGSVPLPSKIPGSNLQEDRYDSVHGHTMGSDVYMTYADHSAYPSYLVTYEKDARPQQP